MKGVIKILTLCINRSYDMSNQLIVKMDKELKDQFQELARREGRNISEIVRNLVKDYIQERDMSAYIDQLWMKIGDEMRAKDVTPDCIVQAIRDTRAAQK